MALRARLSTVSLILILCPLLAAAQDLDSGFSARIFPDVDPFQPVHVPVEFLVMTEEARERTERQPERQPQWFAAVQLIGSSDVRIGGGILGHARTDVRYPFNASIDYQRIDPDASPSSIDKLGASVRVALVRKGPFVLTGSASYADYDDVQLKYGAALSSEFRLAKQWSVGGSLGWIRKEPESASGVDDLAPAVELIYSIPNVPLAIAAAYNFENDVDSENYRLMLSWTPGVNKRGNLLAGVAKDDTYLAQYRYRF